MILAETAKKMAGDGTVTSQKAKFHMSRIPESLSGGNDNSTHVEQLTRDLFDRGEPLYPAFPGSKGGETSRRAAEVIAPMASNWRGRVARLMVDFYPLGFTPDEAAKELNATAFMIRPRFTELSAAGLIEKTGERRRNPNSSLNAAVWRATALLRSSPSIVPGKGARS